MQDILTRPVATRGLARSSSVGRSLRSFAVAGLAVLTVGCSERSGGQSSTGLVEYVHTFESSRFRVGPNVVHTSDATFDRWAGDDGVFAIRNHNNSARGISNADSPGLALPPLGPPAVHDQLAIDYFVTAGLPASEIGDVQEWTEAGTGGGVALHTVLRRSYDGIPVIESIASVRFNSESESVSETVYWPAIGPDVLADAVRIRSLVGDGSNDSGLLAAVVALLGDDFEILGPAIRHSTSASNDPFAAIAVLQVLKDGTLYNFDVAGELVTSLGVVSR